MSMCNNLQYIPHMLFSYLRCNCGKELANWLTHFHHRVTKVFCDPLVAP